MGQRGRRKPNQDKIKNNGKIIRCNLSKRPVFENDDCTRFIKSVDSNIGSNCKNCKYSF